MMDCETIKQRRQLDAPEIVVLCRALICAKRAAIPRLGHEEQNAGIFDLSQSLGRAASYDVFFRSVREIKVMTLASFVRVCSLTSAVLSAAILQSTADSQAQALLGWPAKNMITPVIVAHGGLYGLCDRRAAKGAAWGVNRVGWTINITAAQRPAFDQLLVAVIEAADLSKGTCPAAIPAASDERLLVSGTSPGELEASCRRYPAGVQQFLRLAQR